MRLTVFGATGGIGGEVVRQALEAGHEVTAVVRDPARLKATGAGLEVVRSDLADPEALRPAVEGRDAVLSGLGASSNKQASTGLAARLTGSVLKAMEVADTRRLLVVSAAPLAPARPGEALLDRAMMSAVGRFLKPVYDDLREMEAALAASTADWTSVRPPKLTNGPLTGTYRTEYGSNPPRSRSISRADVAHAMLALVDEPAAVKQGVGVAY